jgi:hypothetical protein
MVNAFTTACDALFADPNLGSAATFMPLAGGSSAVRVVTRAPDEFRDVSSSVVETPTMTLEVRVSDCPAIVVGDRFVINSVTYTVQGVPLRDDLQLIWLVDVYAS